ncbi:MAG: DUF2339 domain-containing protein [Lachnospiraceae bacterium]|nr:DUF2339 domain-containing protein [Lachnospiraceae bacterium]
MNAEERLQALEAKVLTLEKEVNQLKTQLSQAKTETSHPARSQTCFVQAKESVSKIPASSSNQPVSANGQAVNRPVSNNNQNISTRNVANRPDFEHKSRISTAKKENLETTIGKNVIGIMASILFFIAFIVFGTFIYQNLGDMGKSILLFAGSFLITGIGLLLQKKLKNSFSLSVIGCGMGCFYITLIINTVYFEFLSELGLYSLLLVWLLGMSRLSKKYDSLLLCVIGQCGLYLSILLGITNRTISDFLWFSFFVFFLVADIFYLRICSVEKQRNLHTFSTIATIVSCGLIATRNNQLFLTYTKEGTNIGFVLIYFIIMLVLATYSLYHFHKTAKESMKTSKSFISFLASLYFFSVLIIYGQTTEMIQLGLDAKPLLINMIHLFFYTGAIVYLILLVEKFTLRKFTNFISILNLSFVVILLVTCFQSLQWDDYSLLLLLALSLLFYGFYKGTKCYQSLGFLVLFIHFWTGSGSFLLHFCLTMAAFFFIFWLQKKYLESYSGTTKAVLYFLFLIYCFQPASYLNSYLRANDYVSLSTAMLYVLLLTPFQLFFIKSDFIKNYKDLTRTEKHMELFVRGGNILLLFMGANCLYDSLPLWAYLFIVIATSVLCFLGVRPFMERHAQKLWAGFWIGIKITLYLSAVFYSTPVSNRILFSILLLCIAIAAILSGFKFKYKSLRVYGLGLTMMSVVKLILFDVDYSSTLGTVTALIICGVLCFIINFIYNMLSKHIATEESIKEES